MLADISEKLIRCCTRYDYEESITVLVGEEKKKYVIHKNIVCQSSPFFDAAVKGQWKEAAEMVVRMPETKPEIFSAYVGWLYTGNLDVKATPDTKYTKAMEPADVEAIQFKLVDAYRLGDYVQDPTFRNAVVDDWKTLTESTEQLFSVAVINRLWNLVGHDSKLTSMITDYYAADCTTAVFDEVAERLPHSLVVRIARRGIEERAMDFNQRKPRNRPRCCYHDHESEDMKCESTDNQGNFRGPTMGPIRGNFRVR